MAQWDVFSSRPLEGNSLAVFLDGRGLTDAEMQSIAKEMNLSETTFILPRDAVTESERGIRVRIFTVREELPFAGHPTLGTAFALRARSDAKKAGAREKEVVLELNVGKVPVTFEDNAAAPAFGEMTQIDPTFGMQHEREAVARATGLRAQDFDDSLPIETISTGLPYTLTPLKSLAGMRNLQIDLNRGSEYLAQTGGRFFYFTLHARLTNAKEISARNPQGIRRCGQTQGKHQWTRQGCLGPDLSGLRSSSGSMWPSAWQHAEFNEHAGLHKE